MGYSPDVRLYHFLEDHIDHDLPEHYREAKLKAAILDYNEDHGTYYDPGNAYDDFINYLREQIDK